MFAVRRVTIANWERGNILSCSMWSTKTLKSCNVMWCLTFTGGCPVPFEAEQSRPSLPHSPLALLWAFYSPPTWPPHGAGLPHLRRFPWQELCGPWWVLCPSATYPSIMNLASNSMSSVRIGLQFIITYMIIITYISLLIWLLMLILTRLLWMLWVIHEPTVLWTLRPPKHVYKYVENKWMNQYHHHCYHQYECWRSYWL